MGYGSPPVRLLEWIVGLIRDPGALITWGGYPALAAIVFMETGAVIGPPTCGPCLGGHMGILAPGETAIATTNRNFTGRMGHPQSKVYLANPAVTAASAVTGRICGPESL